MGVFVEWLTAEGESEEEEPPWYCQGWFVPAWLLLLYCFTWHFMYPLVSYGDEEFCPAPHVQSSPPQSCESPPPPPACDVAAPGAARKTIEFKSAMGDVEAMTDLGVLYAKDYNYYSAESWFRKAAEKGGKRGMHELGLILANGHKGGRHRDYDGAAYWWSKAAQTGCGRAAFSVGELLQLELVKGEDWAPWLSLNLSKWNVSHQVNAVAEWYYNASLLGSVSIGERLKKLQADNATVYWAEHGNVHKAGSFQFAMAKYYMRDTPYDDKKLPLVASRDWHWKNVHNSVSWTVSARRMGFPAAELWGAKLLAGWMRDPEVAILRYRDAAETHRLREDNDLLLLCEHRRAEQKQNATTSLDRNVTDTKNTMYTYVTDANETDTRSATRNVSEADEACADATLVRLGFLVSTEVPAGEPPPTVNETVVPVPEGVAVAAETAAVEPSAKKETEGTCGRLASECSLSTRGEQPEDVIDRNELRRTEDAAELQAKIFAPQSVLNTLSPPARSRDASAADYRTTEKYLKSVKAPSPPAPVKIRRIAPKHKDANIRDNQDLKISYDSSGAWLSV